MCEENDFADAMADVKPLRSPNKTVPRRTGIRRRRFTDTNDEEERLLWDFVEGKINFDWSFHPDYQEGGPERKNRPLIKKLRSGGFSVQAELDLHGLKRDEASGELEAFLKECVRRQFRCVRIIHGKGKRSHNRIPILKRMLPKWLSSKRIAPYVVAFTSAAPADGGVGATYVLLRGRRLR